MGRSITRRLASTLATAAVVTAGLTLPVSPASAQTGSATGYAALNGGTTGGAGGQVVRATTGTEIHQALCQRPSTSTPIIIQVEGTINHGNTSKVSGPGCDTASDKIELKKISNVTIVGVGNGALFDQIGIHIRESRNIIIQNVHIRNVKKSGSPTSNGGDAIGMEKDVRNVWVDHVTLEASGGESEGYDGLFDLKDNTQYVTLSYSILRNSGRGGLIGSSESDLSNGYITFHHNLYENIDSRTPLLRGGVAHMYNNHYVRLNNSGINSRAGARAKVENNYFQNSKDVLGTFYTNERGYWEVRGNIFDNVTWSSQGNENYPAGPNPQSTTSVSIPYSYRLDDAGCVPQIVSQTAGANKGNRVSDGNCRAEDPGNPGIRAIRIRGTLTRAPPPRRHQPQHRCRRRRLQQGQRDQLQERHRRRHEHLLVAERLHRPHLGQVGLERTVSAIHIREAAGAVGNIGSRRVVNNDTGAVLATGTGAGVITFTPPRCGRSTSRSSAPNGTPRVPSSKPTPLTAEPTRRQP